MEKSGYIQEIFRIKLILVRICWRVNEKVDFIGDTPPPVSVVKNQVGNGTVTDLKYLEEYI